MNELNNKTEMDAEEQMRINHFAYSPSPKTSTTTSDVIPQKMLTSTNGTGIMKTDSPSEKISFKKTHINIDTSGGNTLSDHFHGKMTHRIPVIEAVYEFLAEN